ncbi:MAG TPA: peptidoglycan editing factor PgeF [Gammaproteobacteria bacterium]|nr:peptidoglycan editing factor PgeF [Gammaproteobacteria bacterium]
MTARLGFRPHWPAPPQVRAFVTERAGGASEGRYAGLNLATHVGDTPAAVAANRAQLRGAAALPAEPRWLEQVHGTTVVDLDGAGAALPPADGAVTSRPGVVCAVLTADCPPVLLCDRAGTRVGVAHAGWRGLLHGVLPAAVAALGGDPADLLAWLGPAIGPGVYEVGAEVRHAFIAADPRAAAHFAPNARGRWQADLYGLARSSLGAAGVREVFGGGFCTFTERERFFSHRREAPCGRMATLIWITGDAA